LILYIIFSVCRTRATIALMFRTEETSNQNENALYIERYSRTRNKMYNLKQRTE
jgi:hypothetical protein